MSNTPITDEQEILAKEMIHQINAVVVQFLEKGFEIEKLSDVMLGIILGITLRQLNCPAEDVPDIIANRIRDIARHLSDPAKREWFEEKVVSAAKDIRVNGLPVPISQETMREFADAITPRYVSAIPFDTPRTPLTEDELRSMNAAHVAVQNLHVAVQNLNNLHLPKLGDSVRTWPVPLTQAEINSISAAIGFMRSACSTANFTRMLNHYMPTFSQLDEKLDQAEQDLASAPRKTEH